MEKFHRYANAYFCSPGPDPENAYTFVVFFWGKNAYTQFPEHLYMHFLGWPGISKICIFLGKMHMFQDPGLEKKCISAFFQKNGKIPPICIFSRKMHVFAAQTLTQKMHYIKYTFGMFFWGDINHMPYTIYYKT